MKKNLALLICLLLIISCNKKEDNCISTININGNQVKKLNPELIQKTIPFNLSELITDIEFIKIESKKGLHLGKETFIIGEKYIISYPYDPTAPFRQFTRDGKYLRDLIGRGNGPNEVGSPAHCYVSDNEKYILFIDFKKRQYLQCIDLNSSKKMANIPLFYETQTNSLIMPDDSTIMYVPEYFKSREKNYDIIIQNTKGQLIKSVSQNLTPYRAGTWARLISKVDGIYHYKPIGNDTLYEYKNNKLLPYFISGSLTIDGPNQKQLTYELNLAKETVNNLIFLVKDYEETSDEYGRRKFELNTVIVDKKNDKACHLNPLYNDILGVEFDHGELFIATKFHQGRQHVQNIDALTFLEYIEVIKSDPKIKVKSKEQLLKLAEGMTENDNPILLIGKIKDQIEL